MSIVNYANQIMCRYYTIFPTQIEFLDQVFFTNGNGLIVHDGKIYDADVEIGTFKKLTPAGWKKFIADLKKADISSGFGYFKKEYSPSKLTEKDFTVEALRKVLKTLNQYHRPYPLCQYAKLYHLSKESPTWLLTIARDLCIAWKEHLSEQTHFLDEGTARNPFQAQASVAGTDTLLSALDERIDALGVLLGLPPSNEKLK